MPKKSNTRAAGGSGSLRHRSDGRWEARFTYTDEFGQTKSGSVYASTQKECRQKLTATLKEIDSGSYRKIKRYTLKQWLEIWIADYCIDLKPLSLAGYEKKIKRYINPYLGETQLASLSNVQIQRFYNALQREERNHKALAPKSIMNVHGILHKALEQATAAGMLTVNPADHVKLPKIKRADLKPIMDEKVSLFMEAIKGDPFERFYIVALFTGMRLSELVGMRWEDVDFATGTIHVCRQLQKDPKGNGYIYLNETKNGKDRIASIAPSIVKILRQEKAQQSEWRLAAGDCWENENDLVFTDELGRHLKHQTIGHHFKKIVTSIGLPETRFHDLRHSYAVNALQAGDSAKEVCEQLGHYSTAFTLDTYAAVSETMREKSQERMERLFKSVSDL